MRLLFAATMMLASVTWATEFTADRQASPEGQTPSAPVQRLEGKASVLPVAPFDLESFRKKYCKGVVVDQRIRGDVLVYRRSQEPVYGKSRGCEDGGFRVHHAMSPSQPTPVRSLLVPWEEFAGLDARDPAGRAGGAVVILVGVPLSLFTGAGVALQVSELGGLFVLGGGFIATALLAGKMESQRIRLAREDIDGPLRGFVPQPQTRGKP
ncbi:MAG: hypothetical protein KIT83_07550 [Bryobacterales bacterium]|nr:hypothetical protein [Bryobacterales bacterium]